MTPKTDVNWHLERTSESAHHEDLAEMVREGLNLPKKALPPLLLYDARGSELFEQLCSAKDYHVTRSERSLVEAHNQDIAAHCQDPVTVAELGSGSSEKTTVLLDQLMHQKEDVRYVPVDISESALREAAERLTEAYPNLDIRAIAAEYSEGLKRLRAHVEGHCCMAFLGGNIGNFDPPKAESFLKEIRAAVEDDTILLIGIDLVKDQAILERAYDDSEGATRAFNLNLLARLNRELGANFDVNRFEHQAVWNPEKKRIEMHIQSLEAQTIAFEKLGESFDFRAGETIHTESAYKYTLPGIASLAERTGWAIRDQWVDEKHRFSLNLFEAKTSPS